MSEKVCVLTGEGARGAYQAGILDHLLKSGETFDKYIGISSGGVNAALYSHVKPEAIEDMLSGIGKLTDIFSFNIFTVLFGRGIYKAKPLTKKLTKLFTEHMLPEDQIKPAILSYCDMASGLIKYVDIKPLSISEKIEVIIQSVTIPALIHPEAQNYCDAGVFEINPFSYELMTNKALKKITVIAGKDLTMPPFSPKRRLFGFLDMAERALDIIMYSMTVDDFSSVVRSLSEWQGIDLEVYAYTGPEVGALEFDKSKILYDTATEFTTLYNKKEIEENVKTMETPSVRFLKGAKFYPFNIEEDVAEDSF